MSKVQFNMVTMKDGKIHVEEKKDLSKMLTDNLEGLREKHVDEVFRQRTEKVKQKTELSEKDHIKEAYDQIKAKTKVKEEKLAPGFYLNNQNSEFFTSTLETMAEIVTDEERIRPEKSEVFRLWCDNSKIERLTGFKPQIDMRDGLRRTIEWFSVNENLRKYKPSIYNV